MSASTMAARFPVSHVDGNKFRPPAPLILFPREHTHAHPLGVSIDAGADSSLTLTLRGSDKCLRASFEHGSKQRHLLGVDTQGFSFHVELGLLGIHNVVNQGIPKTLHPPGGSGDIGFR